MKTKSILTIVLFISLMFLLSGCVPGDGTNTPDNPAGLFWGIWHGWVAPISLIISYFKRDIRVYEVINTGWWYDFGFYIAIIGGFGSIALFRRKKQSNKNK